MPVSLPGPLRALLPRRWRRTGPRVAVLRLSGAIGAVSPFRAGLSIAGLASSLEQAFATPGIAAVALVINSPGGSPAQSHLVHQRIRALAAEKQLPVLAFVEDVAASGGYMIACAADEIIADPMSLVGSIGVVSAGFGFDRLIARIGIDRRVHTQGEAKGMLDPFRPEDPADVERLKAIQADVQTLFTALVSARRPRLAPNGENLFTGAVWTGQQALPLGLVDGLGDARSTLRARYGEKVDLVFIAEKKGSLVPACCGAQLPGAASRAKCSRQSRIAQPSPATACRFLALAGTQRLQELTVCRSRCRSRHRPPGPCGCRSRRRREPARPQPRWESRRRAS